MLFKSAEDLVRKLSDNTNDDKIEKIYSKYLKEFITYIDSKAIDRIVDNIIELTKPN